MTEIRASDAERDRTVTILRDAAAVGRLTFEELADRIGAAEQARERSALARLTADLPSGAELASRPLPPPPARRVPVAVSSVFGDVKREGAWLVPAAAGFSTVFGDVVLDLREAQVAAPETRIEASTIFGDVQLLVPEGVVVQVESRAFLGSVRQQAGLTVAPGAPRIVLTGHTIFGDVRVRAQRLRERLLERFT